MIETRDLDVLTAPSGAAVVELDKELIVGTGGDRVRFLHGIVTGDVAGTPVGSGCHAALLTVKAQIVAEMRIFVRRDDLYVVVGRGEGEKTAAALSRYAIMDDFAATARPDVRFIALLGPAAPALLRSVLADATPESAAPAGLETLAAAPLWSHVAVNDLFIVRSRQLGTEGFWIAGTDAALAPLVRVLADAGIRRLAPDVAEAARIAAGEPAPGKEITEDVFPMEVRLDDAIDYGKGCFLGQEPIVRIRDRGHVNWRLARLSFEPRAADPAPGDRLESDARPKAGRLTSVARLPDGRGVALGLVHVSVPPGTELRVLASGGPVAATALD